MADGSEPSQEPRSSTRHSTPSRSPNLEPISEGLDPPRSLRISKASPRPQLQSRATTALSLTEVHPQPLGDSSPQTSSPRSRATSANRSGPSKRRLHPHDREADDSASVRSFSSYRDRNDRDLDVESLLGDVLSAKADLEWNQLGLETDHGEVFENLDEEDFAFEELYKVEFEELEELRPDESNEETLMYKWQSKLKHFMIFSSAGKPIYSRHGDQQLIANSIGVIQTIVWSFKNDDDVVKSFTAGDSRFVIASKGHLHLVAISRLDENEIQLGAQLEALYMQILSSLTLPTMEKIFLNRPSSDLRRPLGGTEPLLSALADGFTRGSPSTLLSAIECLSLAKAQREDINRTLIKAKVPSLLYGLIVAGGRLVSVIRPRKHSLHPSDLHLIFNMLFEANAVRAGGGESWIQICLPAFNNTGFLYMYVNFVDGNSSEGRPLPDERQPGQIENEIAVILISASPEGFPELQQMRNELIDQLEANGGMTAIRSAVQKGRPSCMDIAPGTSVRHFLFKSRANVQFTMPSLGPHFTSAVARRRLMSLYSSVHSCVHSKSSQCKVHHRSGRNSVTFAWVSPTFEIYCVAASGASRNAVAQGASRVVQWAQREEDSLFVIGGAVSDYENRVYIL